MYMICNLIFRYFIGRSVISLLPALVITFLLELLLRRAHTTANSPLRTLEAPTREVQEMRLAIIIDMVEELMESVRVSLVPNSTSCSQSYVFSLASSSKIF